MVASYPLSNKFYGTNASWFSIEHRKTLIRRSLILKPIERT